MENLKQTGQAPEFQENNHNPEGQDDKNKTYTADEYKNLQAFGTKANQWLIDVSKQLAEADPKSILWMNAQIQNKVIKDLYGYDNLDELKVMLPDLFEEKEENNNSYSGEDDVIVQMKKEQELLKMKLNRKDVDDEIEKFTLSNDEAVKSIPNFNEKVMEELKYISNELPTKQRVERATKLISGNDVNVEAYLNLQWKNNIKASWQEMTDDYILQAQNKLRQQLWLKQK